MKMYIVIILAAALLCTGCAANAGAAGADSQQAAPGSAEPAEAVGAASLYAEVADIISNQVSVKVLRGSFDPSGMGGGGMRGANGERPSFDPNNMPSSAPDGEEGGERPSFDPGNMPDGGGQPGDGETPQFPGGSADGATDENGNPVDPQSFRYTGEERDIIIPIGTPIKTISLSLVDDSMQTQEKEADLADIKNGATINIVYNSDGESIKEVQIIDSSSMRRGVQEGRGGGFPGGGGDGGAMQAPPMGG
jgi:hypothetical protein